MQLEINTRRPTSDVLKLPDFHGCIIETLMCGCFVSSASHSRLLFQLLLHRHSAGRFLVHLWRTSLPVIFTSLRIDVVSTCRPPFRLAASVLWWWWSWEREGRAVEVVPGIYVVHWKFSMCTATRTSSYSPVGPSVFFVVCIFSLGLCFACLFVLFDWFISPFFCVSLGSWVISLTVLGASVTDLNEPPRPRTIMWVRS